MLVLSHHRVYTAGSMCSVTHPGFLEGGLHPLIDPMPAEEMEEVHMKPCLSQLSVLHVAGAAPTEQLMIEAGLRSLGSQEKPAKAGLSHIWSLPSHGLSSAGGGRGEMH